MNLGSILPIVVGVVGIATGGLGLLAGGLLIAGGLAASGVIGGSVGSFMNSGWGKGLMAAATLGSAGVAMFGQSALTAATTDTSELDAQVSQTVAQNSASIGVSNDADLAASNAIQSSLSDDVAIQTTQTFSTETATAGMSASQAVANGDLSATTGTTGLNTAYTGTAGSSESLGVNASQADAQATQALTQAGGNAGGANAGPGLSGATKLQNPMTDTGGPEGATATGTEAPPQGPPGPSTDTSATSAYDQDQQINGSGATNSNNGGPGAPGTGGYLSTALSDPKVQAAAVQGGLGMIGGLGSGMMQQSAMQKQIAAQQWGNAQWQDPNQVAQFEAQAAQPVTVPTGYLQRAQQIRSMMAGGVPTPGGGPVPMSSAMAPPGVGGPVPMSAMGAPGGAMAAPTAQNPRGGVI